MSKEEPDEVWKVKEEDDKELYSEVTGEVMVIKSTDGTVKTVYVIDVVEDEVVRENIPYSKREKTVSWAYGYSKGKYDTP